MMVSEDVNLWIFFLPEVNTLFINEQNSPAPHKPACARLKNYKSNFTSQMFSGSSPAAVLRAARAQSLQEVTAPDQ